MVKRADSSVLNRFGHFATPAGTLGTVTLQSGTASLPLTVSTAKTLSINRTYGGDGTHTGSASRSHPGLLQPHGLDECGRGAEPFGDVGHITFTLSEAAG